MTERHRRSIEEIEDRTDQILTAAEADLAPRAPALADELLAMGEDVLLAWLAAKGQTPTTGTVEGFRLLALHRQAARGNPSFNACRETCREIAYHYNLLIFQPDHEQAGARARMMAMLANHLYLFVAGKLQVDGLGEFCCASRPLRSQAG